jgi:hypothetical protein
MSETVNPCYRARQKIIHAEHTWTNGIQVQYRVRCLGYWPDLTPAPVPDDDAEGKA